MQRDRGPNELLSGILVVDVCENKDAPADGSQPEERTEEEVMEETRITIQGTSWEYVQMICNELLIILEARKESGHTPKNVLDLVGKSPDEVRRIYDELTQERSDAQQ